MTAPRKLLEIGTITRPHGLRGELKVHPFFEGSQSLWEVRELVLRSPQGVERNVPIEAVRGTQKEPILALRGVTDRNEAEALRGHVLLAARDQLTPLEPGEYYLVDLVGCEVRVAGRKLGMIVEVRPDPSVDTLVIERSEADGAKGLVEQPLLDTWVERVDVAARLVELSSEDGLID